MRVDVEVLDEAGDGDDASDGSRWGDQHEPATVALECLVCFEHDSEPTRVDERHLGHVDAEVVDERRREQDLAKERSGVGVDLARQHQAVGAVIDSQRWITSKHRCHRTDVETNHS